MITEEIRFGEKWIIVTNEKYEAWGSSHVVAWGSSHVVAWGSSHVVARESSHVEARGSSHVEAWGSSHVEAWGSSHVVARDFSSVVKKGKTVKINKGKRATIIIPDYPSKITEWASLKGIKIQKGKILLWKTVDKDGKDFHTHTISYLGEATAPDWDPSAKIECGKGLHLADSPSGARNFVENGTEFRLLQVSATTKDCVCFGGNPNYPMKLRARSCKFVKEYPPDYNEQ